MREKVYFISSTRGLPPFKKRGGYLEMDSRGAPPTARIILKTDEADNTFFVCEERNIQAITQVGLPRRHFSKIDFLKLPHLLLMVLSFLAGGFWFGGIEGGLIASLGVLLLLPITGFWPQFATVVVALRANASDSDSEDEEAPTLILRLPLEVYRDLWNDDLLKAS